MHLAAVVLDMHNRHVALAYHDTVIFEAKLPNCETERFRAVITRGAHDPERRLRDDMADALATEQRARALAAWKRQRYRGKPRARTTVWRRPEIP